MMTKRPKPADTVGVVPQNWINRNPEQYMNDVKAFGDCETFPSTYVFFAEAFERGLPEVIAKLAEERDTTLGFIATSAGVTEIDLDNFINDKCKITPHALYKICNFVVRVPTFSTMRNIYYAKREIDPSFIAKLEILIFTHYKNMGTLQIIEDLQKQLAESRILRRLFCDAFSEFARKCIDCVSNDVVLDSTDLVDNINAMFVRYASRITHTARAVVVRNPSGCVLKICTGRWKTRGVDEYMSIEKFNDYQASDAAMNMMISYIRRYGLIESVRVGMSDHHLSPMAVSMFTSVSVAKLNPLLKRMEENSYTQSDAKAVFTDNELNALISFVLTTMPYKMIIAFLWMELHANLSFKYRMCELCDIWGIDLLDNIDTMNDMDELDLMVEIENNIILREFLIDLSHVITKDMIFRIPANLFNGIKKDYK